MPWVTTLWINILRLHYLWHCRRILFHLFSPATPFKNVYQIFCSFPVPKWHQLCWMVPLYGGCAHSWRLVGDDSPWDWSMEGGQHRKGHIYDRIDALCKLWLCTSNKQTNKHCCSGVYMWPLSECQVYRIALVQHQGGNYGSGEVGNGTGNWYDGADD